MPADEIELSVLDHVESSAPQRPAFFGCEPFLGDRGAPDRDGFYRVRRAKHPDGAGLGGEQLSAHPGDHRVGVLGAPACLKQVAHLAQQGDLPASLLELRDPSRESPVGEPQPLLGLPPLGDIFQRRDEEGRLAVRGRPAGDLRADPDKAAVLLTILPFDVVVSTPPFLQLSQRLPFGFDFIRVREVGQRPPATLLQGEAEQAL